MADFHRLASMELSDDEKFDRELRNSPGAAAEAPDYPEGLRFTLCEPDFAALGIDTGLAIGAETRFAAMASVTSIMRAADPDGCRIELEIDMLSIGAGKFTDLECKPALCFGAGELEKLDLAPDCSRGDLIHLIGTVRVTSTSSAAYGSSVVLQIEQLAVEDEDDESKEVGL